MSLLKNVVTSENVEEEKDVVGGGGKKVLPSGIYDATVNLAYIIESAKGALAVVLDLLVGEDTVSQTIYFTNRNKEATYTKNGKTFWMPGHAVLNSLSLLACGKDLLSEDLQTPDKTLMIFDFESKKELPKEVPVLTEWKDAKVKVAIMDVLEPVNKLNKDTNEYEPSYDAQGNLMTRQFNDFVKFMRQRDSLTTTEIKNEETEATYATEWLAKWEDKQSDKTTKVSQTIAVGASSGSMVNSPSGAPKPSGGKLFS